MKDHWLSLRGSTGNPVRSARAPGCTTCSHTEGSHLSSSLLIGTLRWVWLRSHTYHFHLCPACDGDRAKKEEGVGEKGHRWPLGGEGTSKRCVHWKIMVYLTDLFLLCIQFSREPLLYMKGGLANKVITFSKYVPLLFCNKTVTIVVSSENID